MSIKIMQEVWERAPVSGGSLLVLLALADAADEDSRSCYPGIKGIARKARLSERQVKRAVAEMVESSVLVVKRNASPVKTNLYQIQPVACWPRGDILSPPSESPEGTSVTGRGDTHVPSDGTPMSPKPSVTSEEPSEDTRETLSLFSAPEEPRKQADRFDEFWSAYPKKAGKPAAKKAWDRAIRKTLPSAIIDGAKRYARWLNEAGPREFRPHPKHPQGWLNDERWTDPEIADVRLGGKARGEPAYFGEVRR